MYDIGSLASRLKKLVASKDEFELYLLSKAVSISNVNPFVGKIYEVHEPHRILANSPKSMRKKFSTELEFAKEVIKIVVRQWAVDELLNALVASENENLFEGINKWVEEHENSPRKADDAEYIIKELKTLGMYKDDFKGFLSQRVGDLTHVETFVNYIYFCRPPILRDDYRELSKVHPIERNLAVAVIEIVVKQWAVKELIEALKKSCNERQFFPEIKEWIQKTTLRNSQDIPSQCDSHSSKVLACCGYCFQESANKSPAVLCRHILKSSEPLRIDEWKTFDRQTAMNCTDHDGFIFRNKEVKLRTLLEVCSIVSKGLRHAELENVTLKSLNKGRSVRQTILYRVQYPQLEIVYMSFKYDKIEKVDKTLKKEWMHSLFFFVPGKHKWNNLWNAAPKLAQVFLEVNGIVYVHMKKTPVGNALVLSEWRKLNADEYLRSTRDDLNYFHCLGRTISLDLLSRCKGLQELNLHNCYFPKTGTSSSPAGDSSNDVNVRLCDALSKLPNLSKLIFDAKRFKNSCFDLSLISKRDKKHAALELKLGHTKIIWRKSNEDLKNLNSIAEYSFSKMLFYKCEINDVDCVYEEFKTHFTAKPESGIIEIEKQDATVTLNFYEFDNSSDAKCQMRPKSKNDYYLLFQMYNFYSRKYWESMMGSIQKKMNE